MCRKPRIVTGKTNRSSKSNEKTKATTKPRKNRGATQQIPNTRPNKQHIHTTRQPRNIYICSPNKANKTPRNLVHSKHESGRRNEKTKSKNGRKNAANNIKMCKPIWKNQANKRKGMLSMGIYNKYTRNDNRYTGRVGPNNSTSHIRFLQRKNNEEGTALLPRKKGGNGMIRLTEEYKKQRLRLLANILQAGDRQANRGQTPWAQQLLIEELVDKTFSEYQ